MKRVFAIGLTSLMLMNFSMAAEHKFSDVESNSWYESATITLSEKGIIKGFEDGTFRPSASLNGDQFITMVLRSVLNEDVENSDGYWAAGNIARAIELGLIAEGDYRSPITREDMSDIIIKALEITGEAIPEDVSRISNIVKDNDSFSESKDIPAYKCYEMGIITGYPDYTFGPKKTLTRAEASTVILRLIDKDARKPFDYEALVQKVNDPVAAKMPGGSEYVNPMDVAIEQNEVIDYSLMDDLDVLKEENDNQKANHEIEALGHGEIGVNGNVYYYFGSTFQDYYEEKYNANPNSDAELVKEYVEEQRIFFERLMRRRGIEEDTIDEVMAYVEQKDSTSWKANLSMEEELKLFSKSITMSDGDWEAYLEMSLPAKEWQSNGYEITINEDDHLRTFAHYTKYIIRELEDNQ